MDGNQGVLTPRSEKAYNRINQEFDLVSQQLSIGQEQVRHIRVRNTVLFLIASANIASVLLGLGRALSGVQDKTSTVRHEQTASEVTTTVL